jgi:dimeric dUTPase (all-alpha-NTP-PPase superfamily)
MHKHNVKISKALGMSDEEIEHRYAEIKLKYQNKVAK